MRISLSFYILFLLILYSCNSDREELCLNCIEDFPVFVPIDEEAAWSPDGDWIAYVHRDSVFEKNGIYLIRPDGTENYLWESYATSPAWSPDSKWIAFSKSGQIWKKEIDGESLTQLTSEGRNFFPSWSPNGLHLTYRRSYFWPETFDIQGLWMIDIKTNKIYQYFSGNCGEPKWIDINNILFAVGDVNETGNTKGFYFSMINLETLNPQKIFYLNGTFFLSYYNYLQSVNQMIYTTSLNSISSIWIMNMKEYNTKKILDFACGANWNSAGDKIVYTNCQKTNGYLWIMDLKTQEKYQLTPDARICNPKLLLTPDL